ncbi:MAG: hypothetical protein GF365_04735 [Candidatus Buchananbacteria bacterium]|nr:hypothetical protein [Candidatus Buchananbacteria bacterium]
MAEQKMFSNWQFELMKIKEKVSEITQEPVFIKREMISILEALGSKGIEKWMKSLKNGKKLAEFGISSKNFNSNKFYTLSDFWKLLLKMDQAGIINLSGAGLNAPQDLAEFEIPIYEKDSVTNMYFDCGRRKKEEENLSAEGFWENAIKALEG